jgi:DNA polymerase-1
LQNIPIRTEEGRLIREAFIAPAGQVILSADYSQIELRVLAHLAHDEVLIDSFRRGEDVHTRTAMEVFGVGASDVTSERRRQAKAINFGVIYGMGELALAKRLGIKRQDAAQFITRYFERYEGVRRFMDETLETARKGQAVRTILGRYRYLPDLRSANRQLRAQAERIAGNTPIQGSAADLLKLAMVRLCKPVVPGARMILTVHDELVFEIPEDRVDQASERIKEAMQGVMQLDVPLVVDVGTGRTWSVAH